MMGILIGGAIAIVAAALVWFLGARPVREAEPVRASIAPSTPSVSPPAPAGMSPRATPAAETKTAMEKARAEEWKTIEDLYVPEKWLPEIRKNAEAGVADAQFEMGIFYEFGLRSLERDLPKAIEWYRKAAAQGNALAQEGVEDLSRTDTAASEVEEVKLDARRQSRQQGILSHVLREMDQKAP
jgi:TPR repeat protein